MIFMSDTKKTKGDFLSHLSGVLIRAFSYHPLGIAMGFNPITHNPWYQRAQVAVNESVKDTVRDFVLGAGLVGSWAGINDKQRANELADNVEEFWRKHINRFNPQTHNAEFRSGNGWKLPAGTLYNGKLRPDLEGKEIDAMTAVFYKNPKGYIEVFDMNDPRWTNLAAPYIAGQILLPLGAGKAVTAAISAMSKAESGMMVARVLGRTTTAAGLADNLGTVAQVAAPVYSGLVIEPEAIRELASIFQDSRKMTDTTLISTLNKAFDKFSFLNGPLAEQYFIPPLKSGDNPLIRLRDLARGQMENIFMSQNPFDRINDTSSNSPHMVKKPVELEQIRTELRKSLEFQQGYLSLAQRALKGNNLTDNEYTLLRVGISIYSEDTIQMAINPSERTYKSEQRKDVLNKLRQSLSLDFLSRPDGNVPEIITELDDRLKLVAARIQQRESPKHHVQSPEEPTFAL
jgi:hypothetical protein